MMNFPRFIHNKILLLIIAWRLSSVFIVQTSHVPDEYWQSLEVAHKLVFDYGYLTWEWRIGIRSYLYPFLISILYSIVKFLGLDYSFMLIYLPRISQALLSAYADYRFYIWTGSKLALFNLCINWYWYYCATRTLINSFETCLTIIALSEYPWKNSQRKCVKFIWIVGFLCFVRPTAAVIWLPLCLYHIFESKSSIIYYIIIGLFHLVISITIDIICYQRFIFTPLEFFKVNIINNISEQYGKMHFLWYLTAGLPVLLGLNYILLIFSLFKIFKYYTYLHKTVILTITILWSITIYSLINHKEFRFILPILPMLLYIINDSSSLQKVTSYKKKIFVTIMIITNLLPGFYFSVLHQQGALRVMKHLRNEIQSTDLSNTNILFLTTCHATPYYSHLHKNVSMRFLTCEPNLKGIRNYYDETDKFFLNPMKWLEMNYNNTDALPSHLIVYDSTVKHIKPFLKNYKIFSAYTDTHFSQHGNFNQFVIYKLRSLNLDSAARSLSDICEALDDLTIENLELIEEKVLLSVRLENLLRQGHIELAKARYIRGKESTGMLQVPSEEMDVKPLFDLETSYYAAAGDGGPGAEPIPNFDISLRKSSGPEGDGEGPRDPIKWFGVLVPQSLRSAQRHFQDALYLSVRLANVQAKLRKVAGERDSLESLKEVAA